MCRKFKYLQNNILRESLSWFVVVGALSVGSMDALAQGKQLGKQQDPKLKVELVANTSHIQPGKAFDVAFVFEIEPGWHIYWKNSGDSGLPPRPNWKLPDGFQAGDLQYPVPKRYVSSGDIVTNVHEGKPTLLANIAPSVNLQTGREVELKSDMQVLVCKEACVMLNRPVSLKLQVADDQANVTPTHVEIFNHAKAEFPKPTDSAQYAQIKPLSSVDKIRPQDRFKIGVVIQVEKGYHIQADKPLTETLIATDLFSELSEGVTFARPKFPKPKIRKLSGGMEAAEFDGKVVIVVEAEADNTLSEGPIRFAGIARYQACNDQGQCFAPQNIFWEIRVPTGKAGEEVKTINGEYFGAMGASASPPVPADSETSGRSDSNSTVTGSSADVSVAPGSGGQPTRSVSIGSLGSYLLFAMLGGLILNIMPCVLPVISIKILSFVQQAGEHPRRVFQLGVAFSFGIVVSFLLLALVVISLKNVGQSVGWGFQLANPYAVIFFSGIIFIFGLSLFGVFEFNLPGRATTALSVVDTQEGLSGSFMKGVLATVLATPCTAPFLGTAISFAFQQSAWIVTLILLAVGVGMALPYLLLTAQPAWMKYLPKPGNWMIRFKQFMGFIIMGTVVWLMLTLGDLIGPRGVVWTLAFYCFLGLAAWLYGGISPVIPAGRQWIQASGALFTVMLGWWFSYQKMFDIDHAWKDDVGPPKMLATSGLNYDRSIPWQPWEEGIGEKLASQGYTVYVDYTATWCTTCQTNKQFVLETEAVRSKMRQLGVIPIKADYTKQPAAMTAELNKYGKTAVPFNVIFPANRPREYIEMDTVLFQQKVLEALGRAGPSQAGMLAEKRSGM